MADIRKTIDIIFGAVDNTGQGLNSVGNNLNSFADSTGKITQPLANVATSIVKTEAAILALAAAYGGFAISQAIKFQDAQIDLAKVLSDTDPAIESFTATVIALSEQYGIASSSILQGIANFRQAGFTAQESALLQKNALDLVIAGDVEATRATDILVRSLKGFGAESSQAGRFIEALNNVSNNYATNLGELATGMARISPVAQQMGFTFEETTGIITPIIEIFGSGSEAANALRTGLLKLTDDAKPVGQALDAIGVSQTDINGQMRSGKDIFLDVAKAFETLEQNQKLVITSQLVGTEQAARMVKVFDNLGLTQEITAVAMKRTGSATAEVALRLESAGKQVDRFKVTFNNLAGAVGGQFLDNFSGIAGAATDINISFAKVVRDGGLEPLFTALKPLLDDFEETLRLIAKNLPEAFAGVDFAGLIQSFSNLGSGIGGLFDNVDLQSADGLRSVLQRLVNFVSLLTNASAGVVEGFGPLVGFIEDLIDAAGDGGGDLIKFGSNVAGIAAAINTALPLIGFLGTAFLTLSAAANAVTGVRGLIAIGPALAGASSGLAAFAAPAAALVAALGAIGFAISKNLDAYDKYITGTSAIADSVKTANNVLDRSPEKFKAISDSTGLAINNIDDFNTALDSGAIVASDAAGGYSAAGGGVRDFDAEVKAALGNSIALKTELEKSKKAIEGVATATGEATEVESRWVKTIENGRTVYTDKNRALASGKSVIDDVKNATNELTKADELAIKGAQELERTLLDLASNERIKAIEFSANIQVARIEADAKQVVASFEAISETIASTNSLIGELTGQLDTAGGFDKLKIEDQIDLANKIRERELRLQEQLTQAQVRQLNARAQQIENGGSDINIFADNLAPELQAVLESLVNEIRIKAISEGASFITG